MNQLAAARKICNETGPALRQSLNSIANRQSPNPIINHAIINHPIGSLPPESRERFARLFLERSAHRQILLVRIDCA